MAQRFSAPDLAAIILAAPAWARVGLTVRDRALRERAADCLAATILERLGERSGEVPARAAADV